MAIKKNNHIENNEPIFENSFEAILDNMKITHNNKNSDYGNAFEDALDNPNLGLTYAAGLVYNKATRFVNLHKKTHCRVNESLEDTLLDLANYCVMTIVWLRKQNPKA